MIRPRCRSPATATAHRRLDRVPARRRSTRARVDAAAGSGPERRHGVPVRRRPRRIAREPDPDRTSPPRVRACTSDEWGINLQNRGSLVPPRRVASERARCAASSRCTRSSPRSRCVTGKPWLVFGAMGGHTQAQTHLQVLTHLARRRRRTRRRRSPRRGGRSIPISGTCRSRTACDDALVDGLRARGHDVRLGRDYDHGMGHAHAIEAARSRLPGRHGPTRRRCGRRACSRGLQTRHNYPAWWCTTRRLDHPEPDLRPAPRAACPCSSGCSGARTSRSPRPRLLAVLGATDWVDGYIARHFDQGSELGKILDPTADRVMLVAAAVALLVDGPPASRSTSSSGRCSLREVLSWPRRPSRSRIAGARRIDVVWAGKAGHARGDVRAAVVPVGRRRSIPGSGMRSCGRADGASRSGHRARVLRRRASTCRPRAPHCAKDGPRTGRRAKSSSAEVHG